MVVGSKIIFNVKHSLSKFKFQKLRRSSGQRCPFLLQLELPLLHVGRPPLLGVDLGVEGLQLPPHRLVLLLELLRAPHVPGDRSAPLQFPDFFVGDGDVLEELVEVRDGVPESVAGAQLGRVPLQLILDLPDLPSRLLNSRAV